MRNKNFLFGLLFLGMSSCGLFVVQPSFARGVIAKKVEKGNLFSSKAFYKKATQGDLSKEDLTKKQTKGEDFQQENRMQKTAFFPERTSKSLSAKEVVESLLVLGKKYEQEKAFSLALDCYRAASAIDKSSASESLYAVRLKMKEEAEKKKSSEKIEALLRSARDGNADDAYQLGKIFWAKNKKEDAIKMWTLAAEHKHAKAPYRLAQLFEKGDDGAALDLAKAEQFYKMGAKNGHPECAYVVAKLLEFDAQKDATNKDALEKEAFRLKKEAAHKGHALAAAEVGYFYAATGNHLEAKQYFEKAQEHADTNTTMTVSLKQIMDYNIKAEDTQLAN
ncbi:hypothetical protein AGMMS49949_02910 [Alphaproteobacteria bacterium]|nr:hypothetical protein AGMMS49949_02910 [Alphaproteobacteria bacterium]GHS96145.1 hypothetical protein AGMMS50296_2020 [Alphaproteobacteria bacterium]